MELNSTFDVEQRKRSEVLFDEYTKTLEQQQLSSLFQQELPFKLYLSLFLPRRK